MVSTTQLSIGTPDSIRWKFTNDNTYFASSTY
jgi:hypothetical protein